MLTGRFGKICCLCSTHPAARKILKGIVHSQADGYLLYASLTHSWNIFPIAKKETFLVALRTWMDHGPFLRRVLTCLPTESQLFCSRARQHIPIQVSIWFFIWSQMLTLHYFCFPNRSIFGSYQASKINQFYLPPFDYFFEKYDLSSLRTLGSVVGLLINCLINHNNVSTVFCSQGEPINVEAWHWYYNKAVGKEKCAVIDGKRKREAFASDQHPRSLAQKFAPTCRWGRCKESGRLF